MCTGVRLNVYKQSAAGLCLSSFEMFNPHVCAFQQLPWVANVGGVGVWTQSGEPGGLLGGFGVTNTHNPALQQRGSLLLASFVSPESLYASTVVSRVFSHHVRLYWPSALFDQCVENTIESELEGLEDTPASPLQWYAARKGECYIGVHCTQKSTSDNTPPTKIALWETGRRRVGKDSGAVEAKQTIDRILCEKQRHSWLIVVATTAEHSTLQHFIRDRLGKISIREVVGECPGLFQRFCRFSLA
jgi:hypothetical protein